MDATWLYGLPRGAFPLVHRLTGKGQNRVRRGILWFFHVIMTRVTLCVCYVPHTDVDIIHTDVDINNTDANSVDTERGVNQYQVQFKKKSTYTSNILYIQLYPMRNEQ
jgi:hypothetical protein